VWRVLAWSAAGASGFCAIAVSVVDRRLQAYRRPEVPASSYRWVPLRIRSDLYLPSGSPLVVKAWLLIGGMYGLGFLALMLFLLTS
jgi:hypothetical protein